MNLKQVVMLAALVFFLVFGTLMVFGAWTVWYRSTGFQEQFQPAPKPQKAPYPVTPTAVVMTTGKEPEADFRDQARNLGNPVAPVVESVNSGKKIFMIYCSPCHGKNGDGSGLMGTVPRLRPATSEENENLANYLSGYLGYRPNVNLNFVLEEPDGELYYTITNGGEAIMPGFRDALSPKQRWDLINYIKRGLGGSLGG